MDNALNKFSIVTFIIQMIVLFAIIAGIYLYMRYKKKKMQKELDDKWDDSSEI